MNEYFACFGLPGTFVLTWLISLIAVILACIRRKKYAYFCAAAMVMSSCGDMFMTRFGNITEIFPNYFIIGAALFMIAHVLYTISYRLLAKSKGYRYFNGGVITAIVIALVCVTYFTIICAQRNDFSMYFLCMLYLIVITVNCATVFPMHFISSPIINGIIRRGRWPLRCWASPARTIMVWRALRPNTNRCWQACPVGSSPPKTALEIKCPPLWNTPRWWTP